MFQAAHIDFGAAGMRGDQVIGEELLFPCLAGEGIELLFELEQAGLAGFPHFLQHMFFGVLGGNLYLPGDMLFDDLFQIFAAVVGIGIDQIVADAGGHKDFFDARDLAQLAQQLHLGLVIGFEGGANFGIDAALVHADAAVQLLLAFKAVHVGGRAAHIRRYTP